MKKLPLLVLIVIVAVKLSSCQNHGHVTTISSSTNGQYKKVQYAGFIIFNDDRTGIQSMSPGAYLKYKTNNDELTAKCDSKGIITYEFFDNKATTLNTEGKQILARAIKMISEQQGKPKLTHG